MGGVALGPAVRHPRRVLWVGVALALAGWALDTQTKVQTDVTKLVPQSLGSLRALQTLERTSGVGGRNRPARIGQARRRARRRSNG